MSIQLSEANIKAAIRYCTEPVYVQTAIPQDLQRVPSDALVVLIAVAKEYITILDEYERGIR